MPNDISRDPADIRRRMLAGIDPPPPDPGFTPPPLDAGPAGFPGDELEQLRAENAEWRRLVEEAVAIETEYEQAKVAWAEREQEFARLLQERDDSVQMLTAQIQELEQHIGEGGGEGPAPVVMAPPTEDDLKQMFDELEVERAKLNQEKRQYEKDRQQFKQEEEDLSKQMREMEVSMSKERAEMARQRMELQRLHAEIRAELDSMQRGDGHIKDRLAQFQRRQLDIANRPGGGGPTNANAPPSPGAPPRPPIAPPPAAPGVSRDSGIMKRFFGTQGKGG